MALADNSAAPDNRFDGYVYVLGSVNGGFGPGVIEGYGRDRVTGKLAHVGRFMTGGQSGELAGGQQHGLVTQGRFVYAVNASSNTISTLAVGRDGRLTRLQQISSGGLRPASLAIHNDRLYVNNAGHFPEDPAGPATIVGFHIRPDGTLERLACEAAPSTPGELGNIIADLQISPSGNAVVTSGLLTNKIDSFRVDGRGCLSKRDTISADGGGFGIAFRPDSDNALVMRAEPETFGDAKAPGIGSYRVGPDARLTLLDEYIDPDKSDEGLRDPCWTAFSRDGAHLWTSSFIPRAINVFSVDERGHIKRLSEHHPTDTIDDPLKPGAKQIIGSFDIATDTEKKHLFQIRGVGTTDGNPEVPHSLHVYDVTNNWSVNAGLRESQVVTLPVDTQTRGIPGLVFVDRPNS